MYFLLFSCSDQGKKVDSPRTHLKGKNWEFRANSAIFEYNLKFNKDNSYQQNYIFDSIGNLIEKRGLNFFGEEEVYSFDENNSITEFRKLVKFDDKKLGLQEFINYENGVINKNNSHYFDFTIIDSSKTELKIQLNYLGAFKIQKMDIIKAKFPYKTGDLNSHNIFKSTTNDSITFWVKKNEVYDSDINFYQLNLIVEYSSDGGLVKSVDNKGPLKNQKIILRRLKKK